MSAAFASFSLAALMVVWTALDLYARYHLGHFDPHISTNATIFLAAWLVHAAGA